MTDLSGCVLRHTRCNAFSLEPLFSAMVFDGGFSDDSLRSDGLSDCGADGLDERHDNSFQSNEYEFDAVCIT